MQHGLVDVDTSSFLKHKRGKCSREMHKRGKCSREMHKRGKCSREMHKRGKCSREMHKRGKCSREIQNSSREDYYQVPRGEGDPTFPGGSNCLFPIETYLTCDFPGGPDPLPPPLWIHAWPTLFSIHANKWNPES